MIASSSIFRTIYLKHHKVTTNNKMSLRTFIFTHQLFFLAITAGQREPKAVLVSLLFCSIYCYLNANY